MTKRVNYRKLAFEHYDPLGRPLRVRRTRILEVAHIDGVTTITTSTCHPMPELPQDARPGPNLKPDCHPDAGPAESCHVVQADERRWPEGRAYSALRHAATESHRQAGHKAAGTQPTGRSKTSSFYHFSDQFISPRLPSLSPRMPSLNPPGRSGQASAMSAKSGSSQVALSLHSQALVGLTEVRRRIGPYVVQTPVLKTRAGDQPSRPVVTLGPMDPSAS